MIASLYLVLASPKILTFCNNTDQLQTICNLFFWESPYYRPKLSIKTILPFLAAMSISSSDHVTLFVRPKWFFDSKFICLLDQYLQSIWYLTMKSNAKLWKSIGYKTNFQGYIFFKNAGPGCWISHEIH